MTTGRIRPTKQDFDWPCAEMLGFIRTQLVAAAATLRLPEQLQNGGQPAADFDAANSLEPTTAFRILRACTKIGLVTCKDARLRALHRETPDNLRLMAILFGTRGQFLLHRALLPCARPRHATQTGSARRYSTIMPIIRMKPG
jgi:hypothetical protein